MNETPSASKKRSTEVGLKNLNFCNREPFNWNSGSAEVSNTRYISTGDLNPTAIPYPLTPTSGVDRGGKFPFGGKHSSGGKQPLLDKYSSNSAGKKHAYRSNHSFGKSPACADPQSNDFPAHLSHNQIMPKLSSSSTVVSPATPCWGRLKLTAIEDPALHSPSLSALASPFTPKSPATADLTNRARPTSISTSSSRTTLSSHAAVSNYVNPPNFNASNNRSSKAEQQQQQQPNNFGHNYSDYYVKTGKLPQTWLRNLNDPLMGYPKLQRLHNLKTEHNKRYAHSPIGIQRSESEIPELIEHLAHDGAQFDVVMVHGCFDVWPLKSMQALKIDKITARPSLIFLWVPSSKIQDGRQLLNQWGFRKGEDITYMVRSLDSRFAPDSSAWYHQSTLFQPTTWHCLMGLKGTLRRSSDSELINCNVDTDVILEALDEVPNVVPQQIYSIIENFTSMGRKLHIVPTAAPEKLPVRPRAGWVTVAPNTWSIGTLNPQNYLQRWLLPFNGEIDVLRPQTPTNERRHRD